MKEKTADQSFEDVDLKASLQQKLQSVTISSSNLIITSCSRNCEK